jgi:hypothetical protein
MRNPYRTSGRLRFDVACQVVHVERGAYSSIVDLVALEPARLGHLHIPAGSPLSISFGSRNALACLDVLSAWERNGVVIELSCRETRRGVRCTFALGPYRLTLRATNGARLTEAARSPA